MDYELDATDLKIISEAHDYPITPKDHGIEFLLDNRHLWLRSSKQVAIMKIRHRVVKAIRDFFDDTWIHINGSANPYSKRC